MKKLGTLRPGPRTLTVGVLLIAVGVTATAEAQPLSVRERVYARSVAKQLDKTIDRVRGVATKTKGKGVEIRFTDGTTLTRMRYPKPVGAMNHGSRYKGSGETADSPVAVQVRGRQAVLLQGKDVGDPAATQKLLDAGWSVLPGGKNPVAMTGLLDDGESVGRTGPEGPLYDALGKKIATGTKSGKTTPHGDGTHRWRGDEVTVISQTPEGGSFVIAKSPQAAGKLIERLEALTKSDLPLDRALPGAPTVTAAAPPKPTVPTPTKPTPSKPKPTKAPILSEPYKGAADRLNGLFD